MKRIYDDTQLQKCYEGGFINHLYHIWRHYKWWGDDAIFEER